MKKLNKLAVAVSTASALMLGVSQAQAFDTSHWDWDLDVDTTVDQNIDINVDLKDPKGLALVEVEQDFDGSLSADSTVTDIDNVAKADKHINFEWEKSFLGHPVAEGSVDIHVDNSDMGLGELGKIESAATAVANNASIETDVQTNLDADQFWDGSGSIDANSYVANIDNMTVDSAATAVGNNLSLDLKTKSASDSILLANIVQVGTGSISANSTITNVDLGVDVPRGFEGPEISSVATAVGNNVSVSVNGLN
ncbi:hypothetical protein SAMN05661010_03648 [Modicisalibacter muralis]|uniref:Uncharacterized protein n=1 Tax=Modicisalibacter muralis TaxID=119000 RepID=A0A1G9RC32_9GAMM|nr:hypothetical protein [Halomonas muralis]SDM20650.1 hypothetical protein SAMN05661010_03648 [Halomonas muralis]